jgi:hypothetical protein
MMICSSIETHVANPLTLSREGRKDDCQTKVANLQLQDATTGQPHLRPPPRGRSNCKDPPTGPLGPLEPMLAVRSTRH